MRSGHTEAGVDLARLAGEPAVGVLAELVNDDGTVKRGAEVSDFAREHKLKIVSVADLIAFRRSRERLVEPRANSRSRPRSARRAASPTRRPSTRCSIWRWCSATSGPTTCRCGCTGRTWSTTCSAAAASWRSLRGVRARRPRHPRLLREGATGVPAANLGEPSARRRAPRWRATGPGATSGSAPRFCATSGSSRSAC
jgi:3,4-dihydroxy 2-butanone 4-phosphate synthase / GTP cyclohydrolase II